MPHEVWNLGALAASARHQPRQFIAGIEPARGVVIGGRREPKPMIRIIDAWAEVVDYLGVAGDFNMAKYSLALGKDPMNTALLLPVTELYSQGDATSALDFEKKEVFHAQGTMWAAKSIAIDFIEAGTVSANVDIHMDWGVAFVDWWTWFASWNNLEASPDGNLVDGERSYG